MMRSSFLWGLKISSFYSQRATEQRGWMRLRFTCPLLVEAAGKGSGKLSYLKRWRRQMLDVFLSDVHDQLLTLTMTAIIIIIMVYWQLINRCIIVSLSNSKVMPSIHFLGGWCTIIQNRKKEQKNSLEPQKCLEIFCPENHLWASVSQRRGFADPIQPRQ